MKHSTKLHNWLLRFDRTFSDKIWWQFIILLERCIENFWKDKNTYVIDNHYVILGYNVIVPVLKERD